MVGNWTRVTGRTQGEIHSFSHWAIMTRATGRTDSEIHSFSHWAIKTRATERTDSEIHPFAHWAIMTRSTERTDSEIHSFSHWSIIGPLFQSLTKPHVLFVLYATYLYVSLYAAVSDWAVWIVCHTSCRRMASVLYEFSYAEPDNWSWRRFWDTSHTDKFSPCLLFCEFVRCVLTEQFWCQTSTRWQRRIKLHT